MTLSPSIPSLGITSGGLMAEDHDCGSCQVEDFDHSSNSGVAHELTAPSPP